MEFKFFASAAIALMLVMGVILVTVSSGRAYAQTDDKWYIGEGAKEDMYVKYRIQENEVERVSFEMTIYFEKQDSDGVWTAPAFVVDEDSGKVFQGTFRLGDNLARLGSSDIPDEMVTYAGAYGLSLQWLEAFTTKSKPQSLSATSWGWVTGTGSVEFARKGQEGVTVPAGTFDDTVVFYWHKGVDSKLWIRNDFPYPIKAETFNLEPTGGTPVKFAFELLETGTGKPTPPTSDGKMPTPPLEKMTESRMNRIAISWDPETIEPNSTVNFETTFSDKNGFPSQRVRYDFTVTDGSGNVLYEKKQASTGDGDTGTDTVNFGGGGPIKIRVVIHSIEGVETGLLTEAAEFDLVVVPEFPVSVAIIAAVVIGAVALMTRFRGTASLFGGRNSF